MRPSRSEFTAHAAMQQAIKARQAAPSYRIGAPVPTKASAADVARAVAALGIKALAMVCVAALFCLPMLDALNHL